MSNTELDKKPDTNFYPLTLANVQAETDTAVRISFAVPDQLQDTFRFVQGQFLTLRAVIDGVEMRRSYSICSGVNDGHLRVAIKRVKDGVFSNYANDNFKAGDSVEVMPPQGSFGTALNKNQKKNYMCLAVGSGITPMLSIIKSVLAIEPESRVTLIYGNQRSNTVMFKEELSFVKNYYLERFQWINIMSQEDQGSDLLKGRIDNKKGYLLQKHKLIDIHNTDDAFICGPESMMSEVSHGFRLEGLKDTQIHYELFASSSEDSEARLAKAHQRVQDYGEEKTSKVTVKADGRAIEFNLAAVGENILDAGMANGMELPYSCKAGVCSTCKCKLVEGQVDMDIAHGLEPHEIEAGYILSCQAHPISDVVVVDFDQR
ncbi:1,2-phenylacetyl-CoA epoxidase subunit PaaE [Dasania marina]|uniref:1,2-phenylacetyl-CoA epoxidase subunit PaaE n=1 Tax=Dasania marina TaxID=471499 RepID=UPI00036763E9|nr:1,2-phenylacetyl-CoA epoxidase subunit PaaE [Dasania marina]